MIFKYFDDKGRFIGYGGTCSDGSIRGWAPGSPGLHTFRPANPEPVRPDGRLDQTYTSRGARRRQRAEAQREEEARKAAYSQPVARRYFT